MCLYACRRSGRGQPFSETEPSRRRITGHRRRRGSSDEDESEEEEALDFSDEDPEVWAGKSDPLLQLISLSLHVAKSIIGRVAS